MDPLEEDSISRALYNPKRSAEDPCKKKRRKNRIRRKEGGKEGRRSKPHRSSLPSFISWPPLRLSSRSKDQKMVRLSIGK